MRTLLLQATRAYKASQATPWLMIFQSTSSGPAMVVHANKLLSQDMGTKDQQFQARHSGFDQPGLHEMLSQNKRRHAGQRSSHDMQADALRRLTFGSATQAMPLPNKTVLLDNCNPSTEARGLP